MRFEKSCGAVVIHHTNSGYSFLMIHMNDGHWSFPKGHMEEGESEIETAIREVKEETNISFTLIPGFRHTVTYSPFEGVIKDVVFFLGEALNDNVVLQLEEVSEGGFYFSEIVSNKLTFQTDREVFEHALDYMRKNIYDDGK